MALGRNFAEVFCVRNKKLGNETSITPVESLFNNEIVEQNRILLYEVKMKTLDETKSDMETATA